MKHPEFIQKIDWKLLREQKLDLLYSIEDFEYEAKMAKNAGEDELFERYKNQTESLNGILSLIDSLQDFATDEMGISDKEVFNLEEDEES